MLHGITNDELTVYRDIIRQFASKFRGFALDATCPICLHPEMSMLMDGKGAPIDPPIVLCRVCAHTQRTRPAS